MNCHTPENAEHRESDLFYATLQQMLDALPKCSKTMLRVGGCISADDSPSVIVELIPMANKSKWKPARLRCHLASELSSEAIRIMWSTMK
jgi:hypothetical protein